MRLSIATLLLFFTSIVFTGCGGAEPGSTVKDDTPGGKPTAAISEDPNEVANQMGDDYAKDAGK